MAKYVQRTRRQNIIISKHNIILTNKYTHYKTYNTQHTSNNNKHNKHKQTNTNSTHKFQKRTTHTQ